MKQQINIRQIIPVFFGFFVMGFIDLVGISSNYVKQDFGLSDSQANVPLILVFFWFAVLSIPTGLCMDRIGRKKTVLFSMVITAVALLLPFIWYSYFTIMVAFSLLGVGNTILQVSANPLLATIVPENRLASSLTFGQFIKALASFSGPVISGFLAWYFNNWRLIFLIFALFSVGSAIWLYFITINEDRNSEEKASLKNSLLLLKDPFIFSLFAGIVLAVGIDVGLNTTIPKYLMETANIPLEKAGLGTSLYFVAKTTGAFLGTILLIKITLKRFYLYSSLLAVFAFIGTLLASGTNIILIGVFITGLGVANIFSIIFSIALLKRPGQKNEISGLMMMGIVGGAVIPPLMGFVSDMHGQRAAMVVLLFCLFYILFKAIGFNRTARADVLKNE